MKAALPGLAILAALLIVPFALRPPGEVELNGARRLIVLSPHNGAIRHEMGEGFQRLLRARGEAPVRIDWRSPGGTSEISRILVSEYRSAFEQYFAAKTGHALSERGAQLFQSAKQSPEGDDEAALARRLFLGSKVGIGIDLVFGGGSYDYTQHAAAGRLVDSGIMVRHPEWFGPAGMPQTVGGVPYWDAQGRWVGAAVSAFGICYNRQALAQLGIGTMPKRWADLADPRLAGHVALADPSKAGSAGKAFEMIVQQAMGDAVAQAGTPAADSAAGAAALARGFDNGMRLIRQIGGNSRYFADQAGKVTLDVQGGSAAAGTSIDFYGRFETDDSGPGRRLSFVAPEGGSAMDSDPIALLRGAPSADLARSFIDFVISPEGQALWSYRRGVPGGPTRYALRRTAILPAMFTPEKNALRSDPEDNPYLAARSFTYHASWTSPYFRAISFVIRVMCVDTEVELHEAAAALQANRNPPRARAAFDDMRLVSYAIVKSEVAPALASADPLREVALQNRLVRELKAQYEQVTALARSGQ